MRKIRTAVAVICLMAMCLSCVACMGTDTCQGEHDYDEWVTLIKPTSKTDGKAERSCTVCGETETKILPGGSSGQGGTGDPNTELKDNLLDSLNYKGEDIKVMYWSDVENVEFEVKSVTGDTVANAIFDRNHRIESRLNVDLLWSGVPGNANNRTGFVKEVQSYADAGTHNVDIIASYSRTMGTLATKGLLVDLAAIQNSYIDPKMPWWPSRMMEELSAGSACYFVTGDMSPNMYHMMQCLYVNRNLLSRFDKDIKDIQQMVCDGTWTLDELITLTTGVHQNLDSVSGKSANDRFGLVSRSYVLDAFYTGAGKQYLKADDTNCFKISSDFGSSDTQGLVQKLGAMFASDAWNTVKFATEYDYDPDFNEITAFKAGRALVIQQHAQYAIQNLYGKVDWSYSILPMPKYSTQQQHYYTALGNAVTLYGLFADLGVRKGGVEETLCMMSAVLECWASESYRLITPEIKKLAVPDGEADMYEYVCSGITLEMGRILSSELADMCTRVGACISSNTSWQTFYPNYKITLQGKLGGVVSDLKFYQGNKPK